MVETGTFLGDMIWFNRAAFQTVYSVELDPSLHERARRRFAEFPHVHLIKGDSGLLLPAILGKIDRPALFWLDAHYSGGITARGQTDTPIMQELGTILNQAIRGDVILIDDARCFVGEDGYPRLSDLADGVRSRRPDLQVEVRGDIVRVVPRASGTGR
jgi:hypothetical protein